MALKYRDVEINILAIKKKKKLKKIENSRVNFMYMGDLFLLTFVENF